MGCQSDREVVGVAVAAASIPANDGTTLASACQVRTQHRGSWWESIFSPRKRDDQSIIAKNNRRKSIARSLPNDAGFPFISVRKDSQPFARKWLITREIIRTQNPSVAIPCGFDPHSGHH